MRFSLNVAVRLCFLVAAVIMAGGCARPELPPVTRLTSALAESIESGDEVLLNRCFIEMDSSPEGMARRDAVREVMARCFPPADWKGSGGTSRNASVTVRSFDDGEKVRALLTVDSGVGQSQEYELTLKVRMSISGWKIAALEFSQQ